MSIVDDKSSGSNQKTEVAVMGLLQRAEAAAVLRDERNQRDEEEYKRHRRKEATERLVYRLDELLGVSANPADVTGEYSCEWFHARIEIDGLTFASENRGQGLSLIRKCPAGHDVLTIFGDLAGLHDAVGSELRCETCRREQAEAEHRARPSTPTVAEKLYEAVATVVAEEMPERE